MVNKKQKIYMSTLVCTACGVTMKIPRKVGQRREQEHVKHMYCYQCKRETAFKERIYRDSTEQFWDNWQNKMVKEDDE